MPEFSRSVLRICALEDGVVTISRVQASPPADSCGGGGESLPVGILVIPAFLPVQPSQINHCLPTLSPLLDHIDIHVEAQRFFDDLMLCQWRILETIRSQVNQARGRRDNAGASLLLL